MIPWMFCSPRRAYPRRRGGNRCQNWPPICQVGLSPQARGEPVDQREIAILVGPIPAGAGGTPPRRLALPKVRAYPRRRGGNVFASDGLAADVGLSPQARGEPADPRRAGARSGPIPAGAGGTWPRPRRRRPWRAYPRRRGGNRPGAAHRPTWQGLSPQARGERFARIVHGFPFGPIPAGAGGTPRPARSGRTTRAYPRRRGGNMHPGGHGPYGQGLSPQARGEQVRADHAERARGPIPAGAGGTD